MDRKRPDACFRYPRCIAPLLHGYRGRHPVAMPALLTAIRAVGDFVAANRETLEEIEINPIILREHDVLAVDALLRTQGDRS